MGGVARSGLEGGAEVVAGGGNGDDGQVLGAPPLEAAALAEPAAGDPAGATLLGNGLDGSGVEGNGERDAVVAAAP